MAMSSSSGVDHHKNDYSCQPRGFLTPPATWKTNRRCSPVMPGSEKKPRTSPQSKGDLFHVIHKIPFGDSPYVRAKHVQLIDKDPSRAISLFWAAINSGDRVDSALKDMAVVMKQLDRSDEAVEAIKSFRHLCPPESQESLDNILVELYKQSGRIEEEIEMLQLKLKQVEQGIAFGGKRTKMARSQGKKIQITVEKEYSRLLGNLAWAYMQHKDFKSAEEHYRKALSFESDKNKQCNLAMCLMHMNKLTEAKFLLQAIRDSSDNGHNIDESHAKSYERAYQMLVELESHCVLKPMKQTEDNNESGIARGFGGQWGSGVCFQKYCDGNNGVHNGAFTDFPYEKRADFDWRTDQYQLNNKGHEVAYSARRRAYVSPFGSRVIPKVPFTQPRKCLRSGDQRKGGLTENAYRSSSRKLSFESSNSSENVNYYSTIPQISEKHFPFTGGYWRKNSSDNLDTNSGTTKPLKMNKEKMNSCQKPDAEGCDLPSDSSFSADCTKTCKFSSTCEHKKSWADMVEEDEQKLGTMNQETGFNDENVDYNIISENTTPRSLNHADKLSEKIELIDLGSGYFTQPEKITSLSMNQSVRRSLCFDQNHKTGSESNHYTSPLTTKVLNFEDQGLALSEDYFSCSKSTKRRNRLQVFQDITTLVPESPKP